MGKTIKPSKISKDGKTLTYGYSLNCDENVVVSAITNPDDSWLDVSGDGLKSGDLIIRVPQNIGSDRGSIIKVGILNTESGRMSYSCTEIVIEQEGDGTSGCKYDVTINPQGTLSCGDEVTINWTKTTEPTPTPPGPTPGCDGSIVIHGSSTVTCDEMTTTLTAEATETCDVSGDYRENSPYSAVGSSGNLVKIGTINSGCEGSTDSWSFTYFSGEDVVDINSIRVLNGNEVHGIIKRNTTDVKRHENVRATCSSGCIPDEFAIWQDGGSSDCDGKITIQGSPVSCDDMTTTLTATTNN